MRHRRVTLACALACWLLPWRVAVAQFERATAPGPGSLRVTFAPDWSRWDSRFGMGTPGLPSGTAEPLAVDFSSDSLGVRSLPFLQRDQARLRTVTGDPTYAMNLGRARLTLNASYRVLPVMLELGIARRWTLGVMVPLVRARMEAFLLGPDTGAATQATRGHLGFNPAGTNPTAFDAFRTEVDTVLQALAYQVVNGPDPAARAQAQAALLAVQPILCGLYTLGGGNASGSQSLCFDAANGATIAALLPVDTTAYGVALSGALGAARATYDNVRTTFSGLGVTLPAFTEGFALPGTPIDSAGIRRLLTDPNGPIRGDSLTTLVRTRLGDIEAGLWYQLVDEPSWQMQLSALVRLPTAFRDSPHNMIDLSTGDGQMDIEFGLRSDVAIGRHLWMHAGLRHGVQLADELDRRVGLPTELVLPYWRLARMKRDLGNYWQLDVVPRWQLDDALSFALGYHFYYQGATGWDYADPTDVARAEIPVLDLERETSQRLMRIGAGITFSTRNRYAAGRARLPYDVTASFLRSFAGAGGRTPNAETFNLTIRAYLKVWGGP